MRGAVTLASLLEDLRKLELSDAVEVIEKRAAQSKAKMKLTPDEAFGAAAAVRQYVPNSAALSALHKVMPRSTVELCRAIRERDVPLADAEAIASYLAGVVEVMKFRKLGNFDENHSHVTARDWEQIDYSGEGMTWQSQKKFWSARGVKSFKRADYIHAYLVAAENMKHFARVYRPEGSMNDVPAP